MSINDFTSWRLEISNVLKFVKFEKKIFIDRLKVNLSESTGTYSLLDYGSVPVIDIDKYTIFVKVLGVLKSHFSDRNLRIFLRGQRNPYGFLQYPSILRLDGDYSNLFSEIIQLKLKNDEKLRGITPWVEIQNRYASRELKNLIKKFDFDKRIKLLELALRDAYEKVGLLHHPGYISHSHPKPLSNTFRMQNMLAWEPVLQHYGYKTRWLDLVDNLPIALWFACNNLEEEAKKNKNPSIVSKKNTDPFGYIFVYGVVLEKQIAKGVWEGPSQKLVNLAEATDPDALRPHMQYAYALLDKKFEQSDFIYNLTNFPIKSLSSADYSKFLLLIIRIPKPVLKNWLCIDGNYPEHISFHSLVPSPDSDAFFKTILLVEELMQKKRIIKLYGYDRPEKYITDSESAEYYL